MLSAPRPLSAEDVVEGFDCGKASLSDWLVRHARQAQGSGSARTFVVTDSAEPRVVGYYSLTVGQVDTLQAPECVRKGGGQYPIPVVPVVLLARLARLAVDTRYHHRGIGAGMLRDAIVRAVTISE